MFKGLIMLSITTLVLMLTRARDCDKTQYNVIVLAIHMAEK
jgi:hypothetical protein